MVKRIFVNTLMKGDQGDDLFLVKTAKLWETRAGKPYLGGFEKESPVSVQPDVPSLRQTTLF